MSFLLKFVFGCAAALALAACGGSSVSSSEAPSSEASSSATSSESSASSSSATSQAPQWAPIDVTTTYSKDLMFTDWIHSFTPNQLYSDNYVVKGVSMTGENVVYTNVLQKPTHTVALPSTSCISSSA